MSLTELPEGSAIPPLPPPPPAGFPYGSEGSDGRLPAPTLPPMSSLLRHEQSEQEPQQVPYLARQFQPPYNMTKNHPLWASQYTDPDAPVQHTHYPPQPTNSPSPQIQGQSRSTSLPSDHNLTVPYGHSGQTVQRRQIKKIVQRRPDLAKERGFERRQTPSAPNKYNEQSRSQPPPEQESDSFTRRGSAPSESSASAMSTQSQSSRSMPISELLSDGPTPATNRTLPQYIIRMRQQPLAARACGFGERDRRVIDPPPILQMDIEAPDSSPEEIKSMIRQPYAVVHCTLWDPVNDRDDTAMPSTADKRQQRRLMGTLVASPFVGNDEHGVEGCFFCFPDLSVRTPGTYSLKFSLVRLDPTRMCPGNSEPVRSVVKSNAFQVYNAKDFNGMLPSSELTKRLKHQGCLIPVKKGNAKGNGKNERDEDGDEDEDEEDENEEEGSKSGLVKRGKRTRRG